jgi:hypothetical protein
MISLCLNSIEASPSFKVVTDDYELLFKNYFEWNFCIIENDLDILLDAGWNIPANKIGPDRKLAMSPVDQHCKLDGCRPAMIHDGIHGSSDRTTGKQHVIDEDHLPAFNGKGDIGLADRVMGGMPLEIVAVKGNIHLSYRHPDTFDLFKPFGQFMRQIDSAGPDTDKDKILYALVSFEDFMGYPCQSPPNTSPIKNYRSLVTHGFPPALA